MREILLIAAIAFVIFSGAAVSSQPRLSGPEPIADECNVFDRCRPPYHCVDGRCFDPFRNVNR